MRLCYVRHDGDASEKLYLFRINENIKHKVSTGDCLLADTQKGKQRVLAVADEFSTDAFGVQLLMRREGVTCLKNIIGEFEYKETIWE